MLHEPFSRFWQQCSKGFPGWPFFIAWCSRHSKGPPWLGSFSIVPHSRHSKGHHLWGLSLFISCQCQCVGTERGYSDGSTLCLTRQYCFASTAAQFPPRAYPAVISSLTSVWATFLQSKAILVLGFLSNPYAPASSHGVYGGSCIPVWGMQVCDIDCLCGSHTIQTITDQLLHSLLLSNASPLSQTIALVWGISLLLQFLHSPEAGPVCTFSCSFPLPSFILLSFAWVSIFFSSGQGLLPALSWCSVIY